MEGAEWRNDIINQLRVRNKCETAAFQDIITFQSRLFDNVNTLKNENLQLTLQNERIRFSSTESVLSTAGAGNEKLQALEQKILAQQEELTSLHRRRGESAQQIINLNARVHELEKELQNKDVIVSENAALIASLRAEIQLYETNMNELKGLNQVLRDEHQALQIAFSAIEEKLRKTQDENRTLVDRLIKYKSKDADKMNEENELMVKSTAFFSNPFGRVSFGKRNEKVRRELEEAARESGSRSSCSSNEDKNILDLSYFATMLPTKVALRFDAHDGEVYAVKWSPTDKIVATGGADRKVKLWDISKCVVECRGTLVGSNAGVMSVDFDSTGAYLVGASNDFASRVWTVNDQRFRNSSLETSSVGSSESNELSDSFLNDLSASSRTDVKLQEILNQNTSGKQALIALKNKSLDCKSRTCLINSIVEYYLKEFNSMTKQDFQNVTNQIKELCPSEVQETYYIPPTTYGGKAICIPARGKLVDRYYNQCRILRKSGVLPYKRKRKLIDNLMDKNISEFDNVINNEELLELQTWLRFNREPWPTVEEKWKLSFELRRKTYSDKGATKILDILNEWPCLKHSVGYSLHSLTGHSGKVLAAKFLGEHTKVITGSHDRTLKIWDLRSRMCTETKFAGSSCNDLVTSDGAGSTIISGHFDKRIRFWDIRTEMSANHIMLQGKITSLDLSRDSNYLLACVRDDTIQLIDLRMNTIVRSFSHESFKVGCDWSRAAFGPGGRLLAAGAADGAAYVWNTHSGRLEATLKEHTSAVTAVSWHPQSGLLASVDRGKRAVVWGDL